MNEEPETQPIPVLIPQPGDVYEVPGEPPFILIVTHVTEKLVFYKFPDDDHPDKTASAASYATRIDLWERYARRMIHQGKRTDPDSLRFIPFDPRTLNHT